MSTGRKLRIGAVSYLNTKPLVFGLEQLVDVLGRGLEKAFLRRRTVSGKISGLVLQRRWGFQVAAGGAERNRRAEWGPIYSGTVCPLQ